MKVISVLRHLDFGIPKVRLYDLHTQSSSGVKRKVRMIGFLLCSGFVRICLDSVEIEVQDLLYLSFKRNVSI